MKRTSSADWMSPRPLGLLLALFAWLLATAWVRPLMAPDEGRYSGVALAMLRSGDWLVPRLDGLPFFHKPPLFYWIGAAAMSVTGPVEWAARLPSVLGAGAGAAALYLFLRRWSTAHVALLSTVVLATMPFFFLGAQFANLDMLVAGCIACTVLLAAGAALSKEREEPWRMLLAGAYLFAAAGLLSKGLIGLVLPAMVIVIWCGATRRLPLALRLALWLPGWAVLLAVAGPWFVTMQMKYPDFFDYFVITQHFRRFASSGFNNEHGFWFYLPVLAGLTLPWFGWLLVPRGKDDDAHPRNSDVDRLMWVWLAVIVVFFSMPRSKLVGYVLPALPPLAYLIAQRVFAGRSPDALRTRLRVTALASAAVCVACVVAIAIQSVPPGTRLRLPAGMSIAPGERVLMLDSYFYEIPFYWHLREPVLVSDDWQAAARDTRDNWRKELSDAGRFEPARTAATLLDRSRLAPSLCVPRVTWIVGPNTAHLTNAWLARAQLVAVNNAVAAWRFAGSATSDPHCLGSPSPATASGAIGND
ncbi:phospholipid carrier-dependent glycosyltransferase [Variovorax sp. RKNM96]|uniref:ArnT family glycosyltransferase n=1 Tax=Variovorax sp. RKNM96 TaxID=2681552 RepID=UPI00197FDE82|nr:glycosyltransferase family 39 protein [Variovorax sp. RKNM96]QSI31101.1 phospholipid carrier-dependent glycosyltransferase [Variovorax sp. RKNM96]